MAKIEIAIKDGLSIGGLAYEIGRVKSKVDTLNSIREGYNGTSAEQIEFKFDVERLLISISKADREDTISIFHEVKNRENVKSVMIEF